jgi:hypothetical protein
VLLARRRPATRRMAILWLVTMLFAFGSRTPLWSGLAEVVPGLAWFRLPSRALFFTSFATAVLAAAGLDEVLRRIARADLTRDTSPRSRFGLLSPMPSLARCTSRRARWAGAPVIALALIALIAELSWFARQVTDTATIVPLAKRDPALLNALTLADAGLPRVLAMQDIVSDRDAFRHNVHKLQGYEPAGPAKYLLIAAQWPRNTREQVDPMGFLSTDVSKLQPGWLDLLGVRFAVQTRPVGDAAASVDGWVLVHSGQVVESVHRRGGRRGRVKYTYDLLRNESALPPAFVVGQARELKGLRAFTGALADLDFRREVVLGRDVLPEGPRSSFQPAAITRFTPNRIEVRADLDAPGYLVLSELSFPGWTAVAAGRALPVLEANGAFRAVPLPAGEHAVVFKFTPRGFVPGLLITAATMTVMVGGAARATRRRATWSSPLTSRRNRPERELQPAGVI